MTLERGRWLQDCDFVRGSGVSILLVCCQHHCSRLFVTLHVLIHVDYFRRFNVNEVTRLLDEEGHFDSAVIHINPPTGEITEEDSGDRRVRTQVAIYTT